MDVRHLLPSQDRLDLMHAGLQHLSQWLHDLLRIGLLKSDLDYSLNQMIARMVDAKLAGFASRLTRVKRYDRSQPDWPAKVLTELSLIYALTRQLQHLPQRVDHQLALWMHAGYNLRKNEILNLPGVSDTWLVTGKAVSKEEQLTRRRIWLFGRKSRRTLLLLDFAFGRQRFTSDYEVGRHYRGKLHAYPSLFPLRVAAESLSQQRFAIDDLPGYRDIDRFADQYAQAIAKDPWLHVFPASLKEVIPAPRAGNGFVLVDSQGKSVPIDNSEEICWQVLALSGGYPITVFGEYRHAKIKLLSILNQRSLIPLS